MTQASGEDLKRRFGTRAVHAGHIPDPLAGAVMTPIYQTSTYIQEGLGRHKGYEYARTRNPTREVLERNVAALEGGRHGFAFASGLAALDAALKLLSAGDHVVSGENVYGGSHRQMTLVWARLGIEFTFVDAAEAANIAAAVTPRTKMVYAETPTNPMMRLCDLAAAGEIARRAGALFVVDNTFATPYFQRPLERPLEVWRGERVVDDEQGAGTARDLPRGREVAQPHHRVGGRLGVDHFGPRRDRGGDIRRLRGVHEREFESQARPDQRHLPVGAAVHV